MLNVAPGRLILKDSCQFLLPTESCPARTEFLRSCSRGGKKLVRCTHFQRCSVSVISIISGIALVGCHLNSTSWSKILYDGVCQGYGWPSAKYKKDKNCSEFVKQWNSEAS